MRCSTTEACAAWLICAMSVAAGLMARCSIFPTSRFVRWSDGSLQLLVGDEAWDVTELDMAQDNNYLFIKHQSVLQVAITSESSCVLASKSLQARTPFRI